MRFDDIWYWFSMWLLFTFIAATGIFAADELLLRVGRWIRRRRLERHAIDRMRRDRNRMVWWRHVTGLVVLLAVAGGAEAAKPKPWAGVDVTTNAETVEQCVYVAAVESSGRYVVTSPSGTANADKLALKRLRIRTYRAGGDTVLVTAFEASSSRAAYRGEAYRCGESE